MSKHRYFMNASEVYQESAHSFDVHFIDMLIGLKYYLLVN